MITRVYEETAAEAGRLLAAGVRDETVAWLCATAYTTQQSRTWPRPREHGSERGYQQHRYDQTPACAPCRAGHAQHNHEHGRRQAA